MKKAEKGQSIVETTFGMVVLVILFSGMLDLGRMYFTYVALEDAAGEAAIFLSLYPECPYDGVTISTGVPLADADDAVADEDDTTAGCEPPKNAVWRAQEAGGGLIEWTDTLVVSQINTGTGTGDIVNVTIEYEFPLLLPVIPEIAGSPTITLVAKASQTVVTED